MGEGHRQFLVGCGDDISRVADVWIPLDVCDIPCSTLGKKSWDFERCIQVDNEESFPSGDAMSLINENPSTSLTLLVQRRDWSG